jgi:hypothetical protein
MRCLGEFNETTEKLSKKLRNWMELKVVKNCLETEIFLYFYRKSFKEI